MVEMDLSGTGEYWVPKGRRTWGENVRGGVVEGHGLIEERGWQII